MTTPRSDRADADAQHNRAKWDEDSADYQRRHTSQLNTATLWWGIWSHTEDELRVLGDVRGKDVLELGCGGAQCSAAVAAAGARRVTGIDNSSRQLSHARRVSLDEAAGGIALVQGSAHALPFADASFDVVFCDHGAMSFCDPHMAVPEVARVLRSGGLFAFNMISPLLSISVDFDEDEVTNTLQASYFDMHRIEWPDSCIEFQLPYGEWIRLFRRHGLDVEDLIEPQAPAAATSTYNVAPLDWARRWPDQNIWVTRKTNRPPR